MDPIQRLATLIKLPEKRPDTKNIPEIWCKLLNKIWNEHPKLRPSTGKILNKLDEILAK